MEIKKIGLIAGMAFTLSVGYGQVKDLASAGQTIKGVSFMELAAAVQNQDVARIKGKVLKAKEYIDLAEAKYNENNAGLKSKDVPKLYAYKSEIYLYYTMIAATDEEMAKDLEGKEEELSEAIIGSAKKCKELDTKGYYFPDLKQKFNVLRVGSMQGGIAMFNEEKYEEAYAAFSSASELAAAMDMVDTLSNYNAGLAAERLEKYDEAAKYYKYCADKGYKGATSYVFLSQSLNKAGKADEAQAALTEGINKYPGNIDLVKEQLNGFLMNEEYDKAEAAMAKVIEKEPNNKVLHFSIGTIYDNLKKYDKAEAAYNKALEIDPNYFDALYSKGVSYFNNAVEKNEKVQTLTDLVVQEKETKAAEELMGKAMPILEKAHGIKPEDKNTMIALKQIYGWLSLDDKYKEMKEKLNN